jgi:hypothetical protein
MHPVSALSAEDRVFSPQPQEVVKEGENLVIESPFGMIDLASVEDGRVGRMRQDGLAFLVDKTGKLLEELDSAFMNGCRYFLRVVGEVVKRA